MRIFSALFALLLAMALPVQAADEPLVLVTEVAGTTFDRIRAEEPQWRANPEVLRALVEDELLPYVDVRYAAFKVMGTSLPQISKEQRDAFVDAFRGHLVATYASLFTKYRGQQATFPANQPPADGDMATIRVVVTEPGKPNINLEFRLRRNSRTGEWRAFDMVAEGVSMLSGKEAELGGLIRQKGIEEVTRQLDAQNKQKIALDAEVAAP
ncbi:MAG: ABC transporter substrate-binding protein [Gammaproteobacteria bacterium]|nr:ABC transporter substrate-binding protein [Gammaproteobacteria bacterium]